MNSPFRIKICGITSPADARIAVAAGADAVGLNFYPRSPRYVERNLGREIVTAAGDAVAKVGVFVNATADEIRSTADEVGLGYVQLHGDETPELLSELGDRAIIRAFRCRDSDGHSVLEYLERCRQLGVRPAAVLLDSYVAGQYGGTGASLDWKTVNNLRRSIEEIPILLAGGLTPDNIAAAVRAARPNGVDVASGVESSPGKKQVRLVQRFVAEAQRALDERPCSA